MRHSTGCPACCRLLRPALFAPLALLPAALLSAADRAVQPSAPGASGDDVVFADLVIVSDQSPESPRSDGPPEDPPLETPAVEEIEPAALPAIEIHASSFHGVQPGKATRADVLQKWGQPIGTPKSAADAKTERAADSEEHPPGDGDAAADGPGGRPDQLVFDIEPFERVEVVFDEQDVTHSIVVTLGDPIQPDQLVEQLDLGGIRPVRVISASDETIGWAFPERGVLFGMRSDGQRQSVEQLILEPIDAEPFVLRAEADPLGPIRANLADLAFAIDRDAQYARPHAVRAKILLAIGRPQAAEASAARAVALAAHEPSYQLLWADALDRLGKHRQAYERVTKVLDQHDLPPLVEARANLIAGRCARHQTDPPSVPPIERFVRAVRLASPLLETNDRSLRRAARPLLIDAHLEVAREIGWGNWQQKGRVVPMWLKRASRLAAAPADEKAGAAHSPERDDRRRRSVLKISQGALLAMTGFACQDDPQPWVDIAQRAADRLLETTTDPLARQWIEWQLGRTAYYAMQLAHHRGDAARGLRFGQEAITHLERGAEHREATAEDDYLIGRLFFQMGAIYAIDRHDHQRACQWYERALPVLADLDGPVAAVDPRRHGDALVSMGVSYWETGDRKTAWDLTERGRRLIQQAIDQQRVAESAIEVAEENLAVMRAAADGGVRQVSRTVDVPADRDR